MKPGTAAWLYERDQKRLTLRLPVEIHDALITLSRATGESANTLAARAVHEYLLANGRWEKVEAWLRRTGERYRAGLDHPWLTD
ncbi:MAG TPA: hypothetical protein VGB28_01420 [Actinomycetota bacterium]|jgi:hypothetical protein